MFRLSSLLSSLVWVAVFLTMKVLANPNGAPLCPAGTAATIFHTGNGAELSSYFIDVTIDGEALSPSEPFSVSSGSTYEISVGPRVNGILIRLAGTSGQDVTNALSTDSSLLQLSPACITPAAIGISHTSKEQKAFVVVTLDTTGLLGDFTMDITVVNVLLEHVHSSFTISVADTVTTGAPTASPVASPTETPVASPTETPVASPTETPVASPTVSPVALTETPVASPTESPLFIVPSPTDPPTAFPTVRVSDFTDSPTPLVTDFTDSPTPLVTDFTDSPTPLVSDISDSPTPLVPDFTDSPTSSPVLPAPVAEPPTPKSRRRPRNRNHSRAGTLRVRKPTPDDF